MESKKHLVLVIYDVSDNRRRLRLARLLLSFGFRVQKSAFEAKLDYHQYEKLTSEIVKYVDQEDYVSIYKITGQSEVTYFGKSNSIEDEDMFII